MTIGVTVPRLTLRPASDGCYPVGRRLGKFPRACPQSGVNNGFECRLAVRLSGSSFYVQVL